jgi:hypothetical protein
VSVGHVARLVEAAGIPTVAIYVEAFAHYAEAMKVPRTLIVPHPMGRPVGPPGDSERHLDVVRAALAMIDEVSEGGVMSTMPGAYRPQPRPQ